jgi:hypothetical protein
MAQRTAPPAAGTFRTRLEITNRSGRVTRDYRLLLLRDRVCIAYADGWCSYDVRFVPEVGEVVCTCPAFEDDGCCKHQGAVLALLEGLAERLGRAVVPVVEGERLP